MFPVYEDYSTSLDIAVNNNPHPTPPQKYEFPGSTAFWELLYQGMLGYIRLISYSA